MKFRATRFDKFIGVFSPKAMQNRMVSRAQTEALVTRSADNSAIISAANKQSKSVNKQLRGKIATLREDVRDVLRGSPFAKKGLDVIVNGVVGWGIEPLISHPDETKLEKIRAEWKLWAAGLCSMDGVSDFNSMQQQVMAAMVTDGESVIKEVKDTERQCISMQIIEADFIADRIDDYTLENNLKDKGVTKIINGVAIDKYGRPLFYFMYEDHPGENTTPKITPVPAKDIIHPYRLDRPGQVRGISWFHAITYSLRHLQNIQDTHLTKMTLASAITAVVTKDASLANPQDLLASRERDFQLTGGTIQYLSPGEEINFPTVPNAEGFDGSTRLALREASAGLGITYEAMSGDLSNVNFSSGRMGDLQFRANVDQWRWGTFVPRFLNPAFERFKKHCKIRGIDVEGVSVSWTPPVRQMIDPVQEVKATSDAIRAGLQTYSGALRELGYDPESHVKEFQESNKMLDKYGIVLDSDPRKIGNGQLQSADNLAAIEGSTAPKPTGEEDK